jgi:ubiquitin carboxyl-terminal hydrolase 25
MEDQLVKLNQQIEKAYSGSKKHPYHLHAICVHDGNANSGHYYAFIRDRFNKKWRRFNDIRVADVSEEDVFRESNGGHGWMTAYFVLYIHPDIASELDTFDIYHYLTPESRGNS